MKKLFYFLIPVILLIIIYTFLGGQENPDTYEVSVLETREDRIAFLENSEESPFQQHQVEFQQPDYFPIDQTYKVRAKLERMESIQRLTIQNSDGSSSSYNKFAYVVFKLKDREHRLLILKPTGFGIPENYFTAFADETSGASTYGGGRYLDLEIGKSDIVEIDFNLAYNPYCAYAAGYTCPLPPAENVLSVAVEAGEKDYNH